MIKLKMLIQINKITKSQSLSKLKIPAKEK